MQIAHDRGSGATASPRWTEDPAAIRRRVVAWLWVTAAGLVLIGSAVRWVVDASLGDTHLPLAWLEEAKRLTMLDGEANLPATFSAALLGVLAMTLLMLSVVQRANPRISRACGVLAVLVAYLAIDEAATVHESLALLADLAGVGVGNADFSWLIPGIVLAVAGGLIALRMARALPARLRRRLILAGVVFFFGAVLMEYATSFFLVEVPGLDQITTPQPIGYVLTNAIEEGAEMAAVILAISAVLAEMRITVRAGSISVLPEEAPAPQS